MHALFRQFLILQALATTRQHTSNDEPTTQLMAGTLSCLVHCTAPFWMRAATYSIMYCHPAAKCIAKQ